MYRFLRRVPLEHIILHSVLLRLRTLIRKRAISVEISLFHQIIDGCTIIGKAITFHSAVDIRLCSAFRFSLRLIFQFFIKAIFRMMISYHLITRGHALFVAVNGIGSNPLGFDRQCIIQFPHLMNLRRDRAGPQVLFAAPASIEEIVTIRLQTAKQLIVRGIQRKVDQCVPLEHIMGRISGIGLHGFLRRVPLEHIGLRIGKRGSIGTVTLIFGLLFRCKITVLTYDRAQMMLNLAPR